MFKKILLASAVAGILASSGALAQGTPSAKFVATWSDTPALAVVANITNATVNTEVPLKTKSGFTLATIKVPQDKELLVGVSAEIGLVTSGQISGKNGGGGSSTAEGKAYVSVFAVPRDGGVAYQLTAKPGQVMLNSRLQELSATLGGVIQSCTDSNYDFTIIVATDCYVTDESIGLLQDTTSAHHFNFVLPNMNQGVYDIKAYFTTGARAKVVLCDTCNTTVGGPTATISAYAKAVINKTMLTAQTVRAAKNTLSGMDIIEVLD